MSRNTIFKYISRLMAMLLALTLVLSCVPAAYADGENGACGDSLNWTLSEGTLTIEGSGNMWDFPESTMAPWYEFRGEIRSIVLPEGLGNVGALAFYDCYRLTTVDIPDSVKSIGDFAFASSENVQLLDLGTAVQNISRDAFHGCWALTSVRLPQSLQSIGDQAFYDCASLTSVVIPSGVNSLGSATFAYCTSLVRAEVQSQLTMLPDWTFFGCKQLSTLILPGTVSGMGNAALRNCEGLSSVSYGGSSMTMDQLKDVVSEDVPGFESVGTVTPEPEQGPVTGGTAIENADGTVTEKITTVTDGSNSTVSSTVDRTFNTDSDDTVSADITVTVENDEGWEEALDSVESALKDVADRTQPGTTVGTTNVTVFVKDSETVDQNFVDSLAGRDVVINVVTKDGSSWKIDCSTMLGEELSGTYDLRYTLEPADDAALALMGVTQGYRLRFLKDAAVNAEVSILLPDSAIRQKATLFKAESRDSLTQYQSVVVDGAGYARLHLGSVDAKADYFLGINVPGVEGANIPDTLIQEYPAIDYAEPIRYEITGRTSSWGMNLGQVMGILAGVMVGVIVLVGGIMFVWNKKRLKNGYVPQWDDEDV